MKLVYHASGGPDCPLLVLTDLEPGDVSWLRRAIGELASGDRQTLAIDRSLGIEGEVRLRMENADLDLGISGDAPDFLCRLTVSTWHQIEGLLQPFVDPGRSGFQWLGDSGAVGLLISPSGTW